MFANVGDRIVIKGHHIGEPDRERISSMRTTEKHVV